MNVFETNIKGYPLRRGKVRDVYDLGDKLVIVATDRISAYDCVLPTTIPNKGIILTSITMFWFAFFNEDKPSTLRSFNSHFLTDDLNAMPEAFRLPELVGRTMMVRKCQPFPVECIVRGYLSGSAWSEYKKTGKVCNIELPPGMQESMPLLTPIFTPSTKAEQGEHDVNITCKEVEGMLGKHVAAKLYGTSINIYKRAAKYCYGRGLIAADTKFEYGWHEEEVMLIDEMLTPDSSRFWPMDGYRVGCAPRSLDKQFVRDYLTDCGWDRTSAPPELPRVVVEQTEEKYRELHEKITGQKI